MRIIIPALYYQVFRTELKGQENTVWHISWLQSHCISSPQLSWSWRFVLNCAKIFVQVPFLWYLQFFLSHCIAFTDWTKWRPKCWSPNCSEQVLLWNIKSKGSYHKKTHVYLQYRAECFRCTVNCYKLVELKNVSSSAIKEFSGLNLLWTSYLIK